MKARQVLIFLCGVFAMLGVLWLVTPADGIAAGPVNLRGNDFSQENGKRPSGETEAWHT